MHDVGYVAAAAGMPAAGRGRRARGADSDETGTALRSSNRPTRMRTAIR